MEDVYRSMLAAEFAAVHSRNPTVKNTASPRDPAAHAWGTVAAEHPPKPKPRDNQGRTGESLPLSAAGQRADARILTGRLLGYPATDYNSDSFAGPLSADPYSLDVNDAGVTSALLDRSARLGVRAAPSPTEMTGTSSTTISQHR